MDKTTLLAELKKQRLVAVIRGKDEEEVTNIVDAVYRGGIHFMEITYTIPQAEQVIAHLCKAYEHCDDIIIGAGTCLDIVSARMAISAGAQFVVCPHLDTEVMKPWNSGSKVFLFSDFCMAVRQVAGLSKLFCVRLPVWGVVLDAVVRRERN